ncbi:MAG: DUF5721 family protein [Clostridiales bacterium]|nr:DUF5721 family protein [Clostridiales bacterium]
MFVFKILEKDVKLFMQKLLREETFFDFEVRGVEVSMLTKFEINGALDRDFLPNADPSVPAERRYCLWRELQPYVFFIIKGGKRPKSLKIIFSLPQEKTAELHSNASAYFLNISFENNEVLCTTASSEKNFAMDKTVDYIWEDYIKEFFGKNGVPITIIEP